MNQKKNKDLKKISTFEIPKDKECGSDDENKLNSPLYIKDYAMREKS
jgi:hypothetical protein